MQKNSLEQALAERRNAGAAAEAQRREERAALEGRYNELIASGSGEKPHVDELLKIVEQLGKSEREMYQDIANIEAAQEMVRELEALAGCQTATAMIAELLPRVAKRVQDDIRALQLQLNKLHALGTAAADRCRQFTSVRSHFKEFQKQHPKLLAGIEAPDSSIAFAARDAAEVVPELRAWQDEYAELKRVPFTQATLPAVQSA